MKYHINNYIENFPLYFAGIHNGICSYLYDRYESLYFFFGNNIKNDEYKKLLDDGFRRYGSFVYKPYCIQCLECQIIRIPVNLFQKSKSQKRIWKKLNPIINYKITKPMFTIEKLKLYLKYLYYIHPDSYSNEIESNEPLERVFYKIDNPHCEENINFIERLKKDYNKFFVETCLEEEFTKELQLYIKDELMGVGIFDILNDAWSSVYFFYNPDYSKLGIGNYSIMLEIELSKQNNIKYYYLGYYIKNCTKMNYKKNFSPYELKRLNEKNFRFFIK